VCGVFDIQLYSIFWKIFKYIATKHLWNQQNNSCDMELENIGRTRKVPKGQSESVNRGKTDNTIAERKRTNNALQNITLKTKDRATRTSLKTAF